MAKSEKQRAKELAAHQEKQRTQASRRSGQSAGRDAVREQKRIGAEVDADRAAKKAAKSAKIAESVKKHYDDAGRKDTRKR